MRSSRLIIGFVGAAANALVLYAMIASKQHKKHLLIFNQNAFDLCSCAFLVITYILKLCNIRLTGMLGYWLCMIILSENLLWCSISGSQINLMSVTVERYLKVVHPGWSKKFLRKWVKYSAAGFAWIGSIAYNMAVVFSTSDVIDGVCHGYVLFKTQTAAVAHGIWNFTSLYVIVICIFVFCYGRILVVVRRQAKVMAGHSGHGSSTAQTHSNQIQYKTIKFRSDPFTSDPDQHHQDNVSAFYAITWTPNYVYYLLLNVNSNHTLLDGGYYVTIFTGFFYICANPFIYATKFDPCS